MRSDLDDDTRAEYTVPRHIRMRVTALAALLDCTVAEVFMVAVQSVEASLPNAEAIRYAQLLRRRMCAPEGTHRRLALELGQLPELPAFEPPLGVTYDRAEVLDAMAQRQLQQRMPKKNQPMRKTTPTPKDPTDVA